MSPAALNLGLAVTILGLAILIGVMHLRCPTRPGPFAFMGGAVLLLAMLSVVTAVIPAFMELREYSELFRFAAGVLRGVTFVLLLAYILRYRRVAC